MESMYRLTQAEALVAMKEGKRIQHQYFTDEEYLFMEGRCIMSEDGYDFRGWWNSNTGDNEWKQTGWRVL